VVCGGLWWVVAVCGGLWWFVVVYGGLWSGGLWWFVVVCGLAICGGLWWFVVVCGGLWSVITRDHTKQPGLSSDHDLVVRIVPWPLGQGALKV